VRKKLMPARLIVSALLFLALGASVLGLLVFAIW
jgi:hypothetical protein